MEHGFQNHYIKQKYSASFPAGSIVAPAGRTNKLECGCEHWQTGSVLYAQSQNCEKRLLALSCLPVRPSAWKNLVPTGRIFMTFDV